MFTKKMDHNFLKRITVKRKQVHFSRHYKFVKIDQYAPSSIIYRFQVELPGVN